MGGTSPAMTKTRFALTPQRRNRSFTARNDTRRPADDRDQHAAAKQTFGGTLGVVKRDCIDQIGAPLHLIDAEAIELDLGQVRGDLG
jgi:hypothetical protein